MPGFTAFRFFTLKFPQIKSNGSDVSTGILKNCGQAFTHKGNWCRNKLFVDELTGGRAEGGGKCKDDRSSGESDLQSSIVHVTEREREREFRCAAMCHNEKKVPDRTKA